MASLPGITNIALVTSAALLAYVASAIPIAWGSAHLAPTRTVAASFGAISIDNRRILVMEWMAEGITHISIGLLVILATAIEGASDPTTQLIYVVSAGVLVVLAALTAGTGTRTPVIWFRICPVVLTSSAALLVSASNRVAGRRARCRHQRRIQTSLAETRFLNGAGISGPALCGSALRGQQNNGHKARVCL